MKPAAAFLALAFAITSTGRAEAISLDKVTLHGYFDLEYNHADKPEGIYATSATKTDNGAFDQHHFTLLPAMEVTPELRIKANIEFDHGADTEFGKGGVILEYGFGEYIFNDLFKVRGGKMLTPFGLYNEIHDASPAFIAASVPDVIYKSDKMGGHSIMPKWITGLAPLGAGMAGSSYEWDYVVYIGNGESLDTNESEFDSNPNKAVGGRIQFNAEDSAFQAGISAYYGDKAVSESKLSENHWAYVVSLNGNYGHFNAKGEYARSRQTAKDEVAWYVQMSYTYGRFTPYARAQSLDPNDSVSDDHWTTFLGGLNIKVNSNLFLKLEWDSHSRGASNMGVITPGNEDFNEFRSVATIFF